MIVEEIVKTLEGLHDKILKNDSLLHDVDLDELNALFSACRALEQHEKIVGGWYKRFCTVHNILIGREQKDVKKEPQCVHVQVDTVHDFAEKVISEIVNRPSKLQFPSVEALNAATFRHQEIIDIIKEMVKGVEHNDKDESLACEKAE